MLVVWCQVQAIDRQHKYDHYKTKTNGGYTLQLWPGYTVSSGFWRQRSTKKIEKKVNKAQCD